uniref:F-box domain-containing protein n=1 Tax=Aegilops tauschii TaxID=37682 RepID=M8BVX0_AEGTA
MAQSARAGATHRLRALPEEIVTWEILVRLPPKALLRCRAVCRAWLRVTSAREFLMAHHDRQPSLHFLYGSGYGGGIHEKDILAFDNQATNAVQLHSVARLKEYFYLQASCDGLLIIATLTYRLPGTWFICCNPATRQYAPLGIVARDLYIVGMYRHRPTGEYRLLLQWSRYSDLPDDQRIGFYVFTLGSDRQPRYIGWPEMGSAYFNVPARVRDSLHWYVTSQSKLIVVFNTITESFQRMRAPTFPIGQRRISYIFEADGTLGLHTRNMATKEIVDIWVLQNYEGEAWVLKYQIILPVAEVMGRFEGCDELWYVNVALDDGRVFLLATVAEWVFHIDSDGKLVDSFHRGVGSLCGYGFRHKQSLVPHSFFTALEGSVANTSPFI